MSRIIYLLIVTIFTFFNAELCAQSAKKGILSNMFNKESPSTARSVAKFSLEEPFSIVSVQEDAQALSFSRRLNKFLAEKGCNVMTMSNIMAGRNIIISSVDKIPGTSQDTQDAFSVLVTKDMIEVHFTSAVAMNWAFSTLIADYDDSGNFFSKMFKKSKPHFAPLNHIGSTGDEAGSDIIDLTGRTASMPDVERKLRACLANNITTVYLVFVSGKGWIIESNILKLVNPTEPVVAAGGYTYEDINKMYIVATNLGIEIVPVLDFVSAENKVFEEFTGHPVHSTEGLRFSKSLLKEFCQKTHFTTICIGQEPTDPVVKRRFVDPLIEDATAAGRKCVVL